MNNLLRGLALIGVAGALALSSISSHADDTSNFATNGPAGNLFASSVTDPLTGITARGLFLAGGTGTWRDANLYRRNDPDDHGLGVCNPREMDATGTGDCPGPLDSGDVNELDNDGRPELIVLELPDGYEWVSVQISSLDTNAAGPTPERGILYADADGVFSTTLGDVGDSVIRTFTGGVDPEEATIPIGATFATAPYLVFEPFDHTGNGARNNDFLVYQATIRKKERNGKQGCTPGFWKQPQHANSWKIDPQSKYAEVFDVNASFDVTLLEALGLGGGGERALARHATAALLNSLRSDIDFWLSSNAVKAIVKQAYASGNFELAKAKLEAANEKDCPLGRDDKDKGDKGDKGGKGDNKGGNDKGNSDRGNNNKGNNGKSGNDAGSGGKQARKS